MYYYFNSDMNQNKGAIIHIGNDCKPKFIQFNAVVFKILYNLLKYLATS